MSSGILLIEPKRDPEIERVLESPGVDLWTAFAIEEALKLLASHALKVVILDARGSHLNSWRTIAEIWEHSKDQPHPPALILINDDDVPSWAVNRFGPVRFSDRRHLPEVFREVLDRARSDSTLDPEVEAAWVTVRDQMRARGNERFKARQDRMRALGILDERGRPTSKEWPADMKPGSKTDVAT